MKKVLWVLLILIMVITLLPVEPFAAETATSGLEGKTVAILGDSISTFSGVSNDGTANTTLAGSLVYYSVGRLGVYRKDTWWQQSIDALGMELLVNNSWSGSCILNEQLGAKGAYIDRCVQLHNNSGKEPDIIAVYLGTNDFSCYQNTLGTADSISYDDLIMADGDAFSYATPKTACEAYAIMLHKMKQRYPDAEIYCFTSLPRINQDATTVQSLETFNASLMQIAGRLGAYTVDLYQDSGIKADRNFQFYIADNFLHPGPAGMDAITGCFTSALLKNSAYVSDTVYNVSYDLTDVIVDQGTANAVLDGSSFERSFIAPEGRVLDVTVTMGGTDLTESCYREGKITIERVTGDVQIIAQAKLPSDGPDNFRWECKENQLVSVTECGNASNALTMTQGSITDGKFTNTKFSLNESVVLKHDLPWILEWKSEGTWTETSDGAYLFAETSLSYTEGASYLYRRQNSDFISLGVACNGKYYHYGVALGANGIDGTAEHTYRLTNRIFEDGSNMVYLSVDGQEIGPMNHLWVGSTNYMTTVDWVNGKDFVFSYMGTDPNAIDNCYLDYIQVWENGHTHSYTASVTEPTCTEGGYTTYTCTCGDAYIAEVVAALGHSYESGICTGCGAQDPDYVKPVVQPILTLKSPTLEFKDMITVNAVFTAENIEDVVEMGMITYTEKVEQWSVETAAHVIPGTVYDAATDRYIASSQGIHAKYLGDTVYLACYAKLSDGTYIYTQLASYSPITYAVNQLRNSTDMNLKQLVVAMLNYGVAAQNYFGYNVDMPANDSLTNEQKALPEEYNETMVSVVPTADASKQGLFANNRGFAKCYPAISFEGAFSINYFFTPACTPVDGITLYYWDEADFGAADVLTAQNASGSITLEGSGTEQYRGDITGITAKNISQAVYVAAVYSDGTTTWTSGVLGYSIGAYCRSYAERAGAMADLARATAVYGYHAKQYFG